MAEFSGTNVSTSAIATKTPVSPFGNRSATSAWSRSREVSLSIEDHSKFRRSRVSDWAQFSVDVLSVPPAPAGLAERTQARSHSQSLLVLLPPEDQFGEKLRDHRMLLSISRPANPFDNATCESFLKTIKREEIHASLYRDFEDLHNRVLEFIEQYYNRWRLHSALGYRSPERFEKEAGESSSEAVCAAPIMTFCGT
jgi:Integrase core domain